LTFGISFALFARNFWSEKQKSSSKPYGISAFKHDRKSDLLANTLHVGEIVVAQLSPPGRASKPN